MLHFLTKTFYRYATKKSSASTKSKTTCAGKRLGLKKWHLQKVIPGNIILRQKGVKWKPGQNVGMGRVFLIIFLFLHNNLIKRITQFSPSSPGGSFTIKKNFYLEENLCERRSCMWLERATTLFFTQGSDQIRKPGKTHVRLI